MSLVIAAAGHSPVGQCRLPKRAYQATILSTSSVGHFSRTRYPTTRICARHPLGMQPLHSRPGDNRLHGKVRVNDRVEQALTIVLQFVF